MTTPRHSSYTQSRNTNTWSGIQITVKYIMVRYIMVRYIMVMYRSRRGIQITVKYADHGEICRSR